MTACRVTTAGKKSILFSVPVYFYRCFCVMFNTFKWRLNDLVAKQTIKERGEVKPVWEESHPHHSDSGGCGWLLTAIPATFLPGR